jgi:hypothetical protein
MEKTYKVVWEIDIAADSPEEAARKALEYQRDRESLATVFNVTEPNGNTIVFDLRE